MIINQPIDREYGQKHHDEKCSNTMEVDAHLYKAHPLLEIRLDDFSKMAEKTQICFPIVERKIKLQNVKKYQIASIYEVDIGRGRASLQGTSAAGDSAQ